MFDVFENETGDHLAAQIVRLKGNKVYSESEGETAIADENYNYEKIMNEIEL